MSAVAESTVKQAALDWLRELGYGIKFGTEIAAGALISYFFPTACGNAL
ncbi:MAG: hypothetical protein M1381_01370 [Deltaproteobacteria bacterium]|nr:hypothetical protein [Deltaproteobacteria bacterium]MCL5793147.1 hypothetical protein [Deltaproteobacteria bacterium]